MDSLHMSCYSALLGMLEKAACCSFLLMFVNGALLYALRRLLKLIDILLRAHYSHPWGGGWFMEIRIREARKAVTHSDQSASIYHSTTCNVRMKQGIWLICFPFFAPHAMLAYSLQSPGVPYQPISFEDAAESSTWGSWLAAAQCCNLLYKILL